MPRSVTSRRSLTYAGPNGGFVVPAEIWNQTLIVLRDYGADSSEGLVFWGGCVSGAVTQITGLYVLGHEPQGGRVEVAAQESRWLVRQLRLRDEKLIAQVHSHPRAAFHSDGDDRLAASYHSGFLSIVVPYFGSDVESIDDCAVFEFNGTQFVQLSPGEVDRRIRTLPLVVEMGPRSAVPTEQSTWISTLVSSLKQKLTGLRKH